MQEDLLWPHTQISFNRNRILMLSVSYSSYPVMVKTVTQELYPITSLFNDNLALLSVLLIAAICQVIYSKSGSFFKDICCTEEHANKNWYKAA